jgi:excisionase family DNA binding protein
MAKSDPERTSLTVGPSEAARLVGTTKSSLYRLLHAGGFPPPLKLGLRQPRWLTTELEAWLKAGAPSAGQWALLKASAGGPK